MQKSEQPLEQPLSIIAVLVGLSVVFWADNLATHVDSSSLTPSTFFEWPVNTAAITLVSGVLFLLDIFCILWWYTKYIYRIKPDFTLGSRFLDFGLAGIILFATLQWHEPNIFLGATLIGVALLSLRFYLIYKDPNATDFDRKILQRALWGLCFAAVLVALFGLVAFVIETDRLQRDIIEDWILPGSVGVLSLIGIALTFWLRDKVVIAVQIHEVSRRHFVPMELHWPVGLLRDANAVTRIKMFTTKGLEEFHRLFEGYPGTRSHEKLKSRVHPEVDLRLQSYILSVPSREDRHAHEEIGKKVFMVALSHWLDDLVDGRNELATFRRVRKLGGDYGLNVHNSDIDNSEDLFDHVYRKLIIRYTNHRFYEELLLKIKESAVLQQNTKYLFWGLYRVAIGAVIFGPRVYGQDREDVLFKHNLKLLELVDSSSADGGWKEEVAEILQNLRITLVGQTLLGLTTKTVQDMAIASEGQDVNFALSLLYSLLYAPLLYFHNVDAELECGEMISLDAFDVNYDLIIPWLWGIRRLCDDERVKDNRRGFRLQQLEMAYYCFESTLPTSVAKGLKPIYVPNEKPPAGTKPFPKERPA